MEKGLFSILLLVATLVFNLCKTLTISNDTCEDKDVYEVTISNLNTCESTLTTTFMSLIEVDLFDSRNRSFSLFEGHMLSPC